MMNACPWVNANVSYRSNEDVYEDLCQLADNPFSPFTLYAGNNIYDVDGFMMDSDYIAEQLLGSSGEMSEYGYQHVEHRVFEYRGSYTQKNIDDIFIHGAKMLEENPEDQAFVVVVPGINQITLHYFHSS